MYSIVTDSAKKLVTIKIVGMLTIEQVRALYAEEHEAIRRMGCRLGDHLALVDLTECNLQLQDVAAAFQKEMNGSAKAKRLALYTGSSLSRMQLRRITTRDDAQIFATREEALAWLLDREELQRVA
jgi:glucuronate isomerase